MASFLTALVPDLDRRPSESLLLGDTAPCTMGARVFSMLCIYCRYGASKPILDGWLWGEKLEDRSSIHVKDREPPEIFVRANENRE